MSEQLNEFEAVAVSDDQLVAWPRVAAVASMVAFSLPTFITGLEVSLGLSPSGTVQALIIGSLIIFAIGAIMGAIGSKTRMSSYLLIRVAFGDRGAAIVNIAFAISLLGWFGININLFAEAAFGLCNHLFGFSPSIGVLTVLAAVFMTALTSFGFRTINLLSSLMVPVLAVVTALLIYESLQIRSFAEILSAPKEPTLTIGEGISAIVGAIIVGAIILPDITRFIRKWSGAIAVAFIAYVIVQIVVMGAASLAYGATGSADILQIMLQFGLGIGAFIIVIAGSWVLNSLNLYSTVLSIKATMPRLNQLMLILGLGTLGAGAAFLNLLDHFVVFLVYLSIIFVPVAGVIIADFGLIRRSSYKIDTLDNNRSFAVKAFIAWALGAVAALIMSENLIPSLSGAPAIDAMALAGMTYLAIAWPDRVRTRNSNLET